MGIPEGAVATSIVTLCYLHSVVFFALEHFKIWYRSSTLRQWLMNLGSQRMMQMGCVVRALLHCLAAQPREAAIFEGDPFTVRLLWRFTFT